MSLLITFLYLLPSYFLKFSKKKSNDFKKQEISFDNSTIITITKPLIPE